MRHWPFTVDYTTHALLGAARRAGIPDLRQHDLRHSFAIRRLRGGANLVAVSGLLRHASTRMSERYLHVTRGDLRAAVEAGQSIATGILTGTEVEVLLQVVNLPSGVGNGQAAVHPAEGGTRALPGEPRGNQENSPRGGTSGQRRASALGQNEVA